jgi:hypothetical protein
MSFNLIEAGSDKFDTPAKRAKTCKEFSVLNAIRDGIKNGTIGYSICGAIVIPDVEGFAEGTLKISFFSLSRILSALGFYMKRLHDGSAYYTNEILAEERERGEDFLLCLPEFRAEKESRIQAIENYKSRLSRSLAKIKKMNLLMAEHLRLNAKS